MEDKLRCIRCPGQGSSSEIPDHIISYHIISHDILAVISEAAFLSTFISLPSRWLDCYCIRRQYFRVDMLMQADRSPPRNLRQAIMVTKKYGFI